jgi:hypothetical protein
MVFSSVSEPEPQGDAAPAPATTALAPNPKLNMDRFGKNVTNCITFILFLELQS